jgi:1,4-alpha-glucan branching enzyme
LAGHEYGGNRDLDYIADTARRQMLFAEASDWPFLITTGHVRDYAERRFTEHASAVGRLLDIYERIRADGGIGPQDAAELDKLNKDDFPFTGLL